MRKTLIVCQNKKMRTVIYHLTRVLTASIFILSGIMKCLDSSSFSNLIRGFGFDWLGFFAPFIILTEILLGLLLLFNICPKKVSLTLLAFIVGVSLVYAYGLVFKGIDNCGCFGKVNLLNMSPALTFLRNALICLMLIYIYRATDDNNIVNIIPKYQHVKLGFTCFCFSACCFLCGLTFSSATVLYETVGFTPKKYYEMQVSDFIDISADSTYTIFLFSFTCPHCINSIGNIEQFEKMGVVDKTIGLAVADSIGERRFRETFKPSFEIRTIEKQDMLSITRSLPIAYLVRNDSIIVEIEGETPSAFMYKKRK